MISLKARLFTIFILMFTLSSFAALSESFDDVFPPDSLQRNLAEKIVSDTGIRLIDYKTWHNKSETIQSVILTFPDEISDTQRYKLFGNSVTIPVIKEMAEVVLDTLNTYYR